MLISCQSSHTVKLPQGCQLDEPTTSSSLSALNSFSSMAQRVSQTPGQHNWQAKRVSGEVLVIGSAHSSQGMSAQASTLLSGLTQETVFNGLQRVKTPSGQSDQAFAQQLETAGLTVQPNYIYHTLNTPSDLGLPGQEGIQVGNTQINQTYLTRISAPQAWDYLASKNKQPVGITMAVLDSKIERTHDDLKARNIETVNCIKDMKDGNDQPLISDPIHGTPVAGIMAASTNNDLGVAGLTWSGSLLGIEVLGQDSEGGTTGSTATITKGLRYAVARGAKVINLSLGTELDPVQGPDKLLTVALNDVSKRAVIIAASGNERGKQAGVFFPASHPDVIAVGSLGKTDGESACYNSMPTSSAPRPIDLYAPGGALTCKGADPVKDGTLMLAPNNGYMSESGTSFAAPQASGVAALMWGANPSLSAKEIKDKLLSSARIVNDMRHLNAEQALKSVLE